MGRGQELPNLLGLAQILEKINVLGWVSGVFGTMGPKDLKDHGGPH